MTDLNTLTIADARDRLRAGDITAVELTESCLTAIEGSGALNAFVHNTAEISREQAKAADARLAKGDAPAMCGIPLGIKDLFCTKGGFVASRLCHSGGLQAGIRKHHHPTALGFRCGNAGQTQHG